MLRSDQRGTGGWRERSDADTSLLLVSTFSDQVPAQTVWSLLGLPDDDVAQVLHFTFTTGMLLDGVTDLEGMGQGAAAAIEMFLREDGPFQFHYRYVPADTMIGGVAIPTESYVMLMWAAANRPGPGSKEQETAEEEEQRSAQHFYPPSSDVVVDS